MKKASGNGMTQFFARHFLGCKNLVTAAVQTKSFFEITTKFIEQNNSLSPDEKVGKVNALHVYLNENQNATIKPSEFADSYFENPELKNQYLSTIDHSEEISRDTAITKDISKIRRSLTTRKIRFTNNVRITYPSNTDRATLFQVGDYDQKTDLTHVKIKGQVTTY